MDKTTIYESLGFLMGFLGIGIGYMAVILGIRHDRAKRELEHKERMMAIEMGRSLPGDLPWLSPMRIGFLIAAVVPISALGLAWLSTQAAGFQPDIWQGAGMVSIFAVCGGTVIVCLATTRQSLPATASRIATKAPVEDDAYDVVSSRA